MDELTAWLALTHAPGLHASSLQPLLERFGSASALLAASADQLQKAAAPANFLDWLTKHHSSLSELIEPDLRWLDHPTHHLVTFGSAQYPSLLAQLSDAPIALYVRGDPTLLELPQLAIVGSRNPTASGRETAASFAAHLARCGLVITSGLAIGIDAAAHQGALEGGGKTIAVCGAGIDVTYPRTNLALAEAIEANGALVSEFPLGTPALKMNFPRRNRIISGLSLGTLVVEAAVRSGSLITARLAAEQGREVFAIPGSIHNPLARGCHLLIRQGAKLVETADDIFAELRSLIAGLKSAQGPSSEARKSADFTGNFSPALDKEYEILLDALGFEPAGVDVLVRRTGLGADEVASMLLILELDGSIESRPGGLYVRRVPKAAK